MLAKGWTTE